MKILYLRLIALGVYLLTSYFATELYAQEIKAEKAYHEQEERGQSDSLNTLNIDGKEINIEGSKAVAVYQVDSEDLILYALIFLSVIVLMVLFVRYTRRKRQQKEAAISSLSERELMVAKLIQEGKQNKEIAEELFISISTVKTHINNIYKKLDVKNRNALRKIRLPDTFQGG